MRVLTCEGNAQVVGQLLVGHLEGDSAEVAGVVNVHSRHHTTARPSPLRGVVVRVHSHDHGLLQLQTPQQIQHHSKQEKLFT
jgi:hypothetical protein